MKYNIIDINYKKYLIKNGRLYERITTNEDRDVVKSWAGSRPLPYVITKRQEFKTAYGPLVTVYTLWRAAEDQRADEDKQLLDKATAAVARGL